MVKTYCILICIILMDITGYAQDKIYYKQNRIDDWKVTQITPDLIKGSDQKNPQIAYSTAHTNVLFIFNSLGNFIVIPKLFEKSVPDVYVKNFFNKVDNRFNQFDKIITVQNNIIICKYEKEVDKKIEYTVADKQAQISKSDVAVVIFKNGEHKLMTGVDKAFKVLSEVQDLYVERAIAVDKPAVPETKSTQKDSLLAVKLLERNKDSIAQQSNVVKATGNNATAKQTSKDSSGTKTAPVNKDITKESPPKAEKKLDSATLSKLQDKAIQNIHQLEDYIKKIINKNTDPDQVDRAIDQAMALFVNEDARIEVSSINTPNIKPYKMRAYLTRLGELKYDKVDIQWYNVQYTSELRKGADGFYYGIIEFEQKFTGVSGDKKLYQDLTRKTVEVVLKTYKRTVEGQTTLEWDVFLGNIGISETKPS